MSVAQALADTPPPARSAGDYLVMLHGAKTPARMALLVRAIGCAIIAANTHADHPIDTARHLIRYESHARQLERAGSYGSARILLKRWGYVR